MKGQKYIRATGVLTARAAAIVAALTAVVMAWVMTGCTQNGHDARLEEVERLTESDPHKAIEMLGGIDGDSLADADRHYYDFLRVKAADKAYVEHSSDSLILGVIDYYRGSGLEAEALYYGGRVYSDLGDYPTALRYFQDALDLLPQGTENIHLRGNVLSQTGRLLDHLGLHEQSLPFFEEAIEICKLETHSFNLAFDYQLVGSIYMDLGKFDKAEKYIDSAYYVSNALSDSDRALMQGYKAEIRMHKGDIDSALSLIKGIPQRVDSSERPIVEAFAANIYYIAGIKDSAYHYAQTLIQNDVNTNKISGYYLILLPDLRILRECDSIFSDIDQYRQLIESRYNEHDAKAVIAQNSMYNYSLYERENTRISEEKRKLDRRLNLSLICLIAFGGVIVFFVIGNLKKRMQLRDAWYKIEGLNYQLGLKPRNEVVITEDAFGVKEMESRIEGQIGMLKAAAESKADGPNPFIGTAVYKALIELLENGQGIGYRSNLWEEIERTVMTQSPDFKENLMVLSGHNLSGADYNYSLLIKLGMTPYRYLNC